MNKYIVSALAFACAAAAIPAQAAEYFTTYTSNSGPSTVASMWFTASDVVNSKGGYDITGIRGDVNGDAIVSLEPNPKQPGLALSASRLWNFDNVLYGNGPLLDTDGAVFQTFSGREYNIWNEAAGLYKMVSYQKTATGAYNDRIPTLGTISAAAPPPVADPTPPTGPTTLDFEDARTYADSSIKTQGFKFVSATCCEFAFGVSSTGASNDTRRMIYNGAPVTMATVDGSHFNATSIDAGLGSYFTPGQAYSIMLSGTRADGSQVTQALDVTDTFSTYALHNFDNLVSLQFGHPGGGFYFTFDNLAVSPFSATPEPAAWAMMLVGFGAMGGAMRRRKRTAVIFA
ncbi:hypothetical protein SPAN111604_03495 [Sphingomonas antarctica]|uniref:PEPxxWA-CTERM sorting domain-containing protein n=1 Tax=Sphingomonas antarctica TaxID=2040274 RepID=UPI0039EC58EE